MRVVDAMADLGGAEAVSRTGRPGFSRLERKRGNKFMNSNVRQIRPCVAWVFTFTSQALPGLWRLASCLSLPASYTEDMDAFLHSPTALLALLVVVVLIGIFALALLPASWGDGHDPYGGGVSGG